MILECRIVQKYWNFLIVQKYWKIRKTKTKKRLLATKNLKYDAEWQVSLLATRY